jgi:hypothetical protein
MAGEEKVRFETHLADCGACTDEFAGLSEARYSVYEWRKLEFASMETPEIVIPYERKTAIHPAVSWLDSVKALFTFSQGWAAAGAGFALIAVAATVGLMVLDPSDSKDDVVRAGNAAVSPSPIRQIDNSNSGGTVAKDTPLPAQLDSARKDSATTDSKPDRRTEAVKASMNTRPVSNDSKSAPDNKKPANPANRNVPSLNQYDEAEDDTLRLADIFDEIDTSE